MTIHHNINLNIYIITYTLAPMPTASTAQILGNNESTEPFTSNMYNRRVLAGEFPVVNKYLLNDLVSLGLWDENMRNHLLADRGSVQNLPGVPQEIKDLYKTVWEIKQKVIIGKFIVVNVVITITITITITI